MVENVKWLCPKCGAPPNKHGKGGYEKCSERHRGDNCMGFICECEDDDAITTGHGETAENPCPNATCYHCGWGGVFPPVPFKLTGWAKKAWDAGWRPPAGWQPE